MYLRSQLYKLLVTEFESDAEQTRGAVNKFLQVVEAGDYAPSVILADGDDASIEGDLEEDAEHVYSTQDYWSFEFYTGGQPVRQTEVVELPNEDKLLREDDER